MGGTLDASILGVLININVVAASVRYMAILRKPHILKQKLMLQYNNTITALLANIRPAYCSVASSATPATRAELPTTTTISSNRKVRPSRYLSIKGRSKPTGNASTNKRVPLMYSRTNRRFPSMIATRGNNVSRVKRTTSNGLILYAAV